MKEENRSEITVKTLREGMALSQEKLAQEVGVSRQTINLWENRKKMPTFDNCVKLASALDVPLKTLGRAFGLDVSHIPNDEN